MVSADLASFLESGVAILVGSRDGRLFPECMRGVGARVEPGGEELTIFLPDAVAARTLANLKENGRVAVGFSRAQDHRSFQVKGRVLSLGPAADADRAGIERYRCAWATELAAVGLPPRITLRMAHWPAHAVRLRIESVFVQTPGPGAGARLGSTGGAP